jgi:hypothetical protein
MPGSGGDVRGMNEASSGAALTYEAVKAVVTLPKGAPPSRRDPVTRRWEVCRGTLPG